MQIKAHGQWLRLATLPLAVPAAACSMLQTRGSAEVVNHAIRTCAGMWWRFGNHMDGRKQCAGAANIARGCARLAAGRERRSVTSGVHMEHGASNIAAQLTAAGSAA